MNNLIKAAEMALEVFDGPVLKDATEHAMRLRKACDTLRQALAQPEQEQYVTKVVAVHEDGTYTTERIPLPKREWVGLTDEDFYGQSELQVMAMKYAEAKLKEKNT